jgi:hypothetical protein
LWAERQSKRVCLREDIGAFGDRERGFPRTEVKKMERTEEEISGENMASSTRLSIGTKRGEQHLYGVV